MNPETDNRPVMSQTEASWHTHLAGMRAADAARKQGGNPVAIEAVATATMGAVTIAGYELHPASQGTIWTLKRLATEFSAWADRIGMPSSGNPDAPGTREMLELGITTLAFCNSREIWRKLELGLLEEIILDAESIIWTLDVRETQRLQDHFRTEMARIEKLSGTEESAPGKLEVEMLVGS